MPYESKVQNWNKINAGICFNYFHQRFYLFKCVIKALAKGKNPELVSQVIRELLLCMIQNSHNAFEEELDVREIAEILMINLEAPDPYQRYGLDKPS